MFRGIHHPGIVVPDLERAVAFYCELAGLRKVRETSWNADNRVFNQVVGLEESSARLCLLEGPNSFLELFEYSAPVSDASPANRGANDYGIRHLCFEVDDVASAIAAVISLGGSKINDPVTNDAGVTATYCRDPFGNLLELVAPAPGSGFRSLDSIGGAFPGQSTRSSN